MKLNVRRTFTTTGSPAAVFGYLADFRNAEEWDPGTVSCTLVSGEVGPGAAYRNVSEFLGRKTELDYVTVRHLPDTELHFQGRNSTFVGDDRMSFRPVDGGTEVTYHATFELRGAAQLALPVVAAYLPVLASKTIKHLQETLDRVTA
jgi:hypothetical protein